MPMTKWGAADFDLDIGISNAFCNEARALLERGRKGET